VAPTATTPPPSPGPTTAVQIWFVSADHLFLTERGIPATSAVARASLAELLDGPSGVEAEAGVGTEIPDGAQLLGVSLQDEVATVDLSGGFAVGGDDASLRLRVAQVVYTVTQFPTAPSVEFLLDGGPPDALVAAGIDIENPLRRNDFRALLPAIVVEQPVIGQAVTSPIHISGTANVFEATVSLRILDQDGNQIASGFTTATCGTGCRGSFDTELAFEVSQDQDGTVEVFEASAEDGHPINVVRIPVRLSS
jgi:hypothetical protein